MLDWRIKSSGAFMITTECVEGCRIMSKIESCCCIRCEVSPIEMSFRSTKRSIPSP
ncbi:hypothetical protein B0O80DRAFT_456610 [Mortierella sp. GBAus27b]|nr:hypothetical protein B0O80DRAFT_456610 [Mortierella sp. GBAus27b]